MFYHHFNCTLSFTGSSMTALTGTSNPLLLILLKPPDFNISMRVCINYLCLSWHVLIFSTFSVRLDPFFGLSVLNTNSVLARKHITNWLCNLKHNLVEVLTDVPLSVEDDRNKRQRSKLHTASENRIVYITRKNYMV